jgi:hypothetical protein
MTDLITVTTNLKTVTIDAAIASFSAGWKNGVCRKMTRLKKATRVGGLHSFRLTSLYFLACRSVTRDASKGEARFGK